MLLALAVWLAPGPLRITAPAFRQSDGGTPLPPGFTHVPGALLFFSFQIEGYLPTTERKVRLSYKLEALDPQGVAIVEPIASILDTELHDEDKDWKPRVRQEIEIPPLGPSGRYKILVAVSDEVGKTTAKAEIPFEVRGRDVEPSPTLVIRNFRWFRAEEDREPLAKGVYRPGDSVWARFDITGYRFAEKNRFAVSYGIEVFRSNGNLLYAQPKAADEQESTFYRKRYLPGVLSLQLDKDIRPDEYTIVLKVSDQIGDQEIESRHVFSVE